MELSMNGTLVLKVKGLSITLKLAFYCRKCHETSKLKFLSHTNKISSIWSKLLKQNVLHIFMVLNCPTQFLLTPVKKIWNKLGKQNINQTLCHRNIWYVASCVAGNFLFNRSCSTFWDCWFSHLCKHKKHHLNDRFDDAYQDLLKGNQN